MAGNERSYANIGGFAGYFTMDGNSLEFTLTAAAVPDPTTYAVGIAALLGGLILAPSAGVKVGRIGEPFLTRIGPTSSSAMASFA